MSSLTGETEDLRETCLQSGSSHTAISYHVQLEEGGEGGREGGGEGGREGGGRREGGREGGRRERGREEGGREGGGRSEEWGEK